MPQIFLWPSSIHKKCHNSCFQSWLTTKIFPFRVLVKHHLWDNLCIVSMSLSHKWPHWDPHLWSSGQRSRFLKPTFSESIQWELCPEGLSWWSHLDTHFYFISNEMTIHYQDFMRRGKLSTFQKYSPRLITLSITIASTSAQKAWIFSEWLDLLNHLP